MRNLTVRPLAATLAAAVSIAAAVAAATAPMPALAAESYATCTGYIDSLPAVVNKPGTWCLRASLATAAASGAAITVAGNHITIDCNDFRLQGTADPTATTTVGIAASARANVTVRHCRIDGFSTGISLVGRGHVVHDNQLERLNANGIYVQANPGLVRDNRLADIGLDGSRPAPRGISVNGDVDVLRNVLDRVQGQHATSPTVAILSRGGQSNVIAGNEVRRVRNVLAGGTIGIQGNGNAISRTVVQDNLLSSAGPGQAGAGISCGSPTMLAVDNQVAGWSTGVTAACADGDNVETP